MEVRELATGDVESLRAYLLRDPCQHAYLLGTLHWFGVAGPRARFVGAFADGALVGALAEGREVHCWYGSVAADAAPIARALGAAMSPHVSVFLGDEALVDALLAPVAGRRRYATRMVFSTGDPHVGYPEPKHPVRLATAADLPALVDLYEGYEMDGYPTRRHLHRALLDRIRHTAIFVVDQDDRPVSAERIDGGSPEVWVVGGLTTDPAHRKKGLGLSVRLGALREARRRGTRTMSLRDPRNALHRRSLLRPTGWWLIVALQVPPPPPWRQLAHRVLARLSPWDRPCRRRPMCHLAEPQPPEQHDLATLRS